MCLCHWQVWTEGQKKLIHGTFPACKHVTLQVPASAADYVVFYQQPKVVAEAVLAMVRTWREDHRLAA